MASSFVLGVQPWWIFTDKNGKPLAGGKLYTYSNLTNELKPTFKDTAGEFPQENPIVLDGSGMVESEIYWELNGEELYNLKLFNADGDEIRAINNYNPSEGGGGGENITNNYLSDNYIQNIDFKFNDSETLSNIPAGDTNIAPGGWFLRKAESVAVDQLSFNRIGLGSTLPEGNPAYELVYQASSFTGNETEKLLFVKIPNVKQFNGEEVTFDFWALSSISVAGEIVLIQHFGTGGSPSNDAVQLFPFTFPTVNYGRVTQSFVVDSSASSSLGTNGDDYIAVGIRFPLTTPGRFQFTNFGFTRGPVVPVSGYEDTQTQTFYKCIEDLLPVLVQQYFDSFLPSGIVVGSFVDYGMYGLKGFLKLEEQTIGNANSGAVCADDKYKNLFLLLWSSTDDHWAPVSGGRGASNLDDWNANKTLRFPWTKSRVLGCVGQGSGLSTRVNGETTGSETNVISFDNMPPHQHSVEIPMYRGRVFADRDSGLANVLVGSGYAPFNFNTTSSGSGTPMNNMQPTTFLFHYIKY